MTVRVGGQGRLTEKVTAEDRPRVGEEVTLKSRKVPEIACGAQELLSKY